MTKKIDKVVLGSFKEQVISRVAPSILDPFFKDIMEGESPGNMVAFQNAEEAILRGERRKEDPEKVAAEVDKFLAAYLSIEDVS